MITINFADAKASVETINNRAIVETNVTIFFIITSHVL